MPSTAAQQHDQNVDTLVSAATKVVPPPPALNPLLARGKLKKTNSGGVKKKSSKAKQSATRTELIKDVYQAKQGELAVVSQGGADPAEEGAVLNLADQLLQQLGNQLEEDEQRAGTETAADGGATLARTSASFPPGNDAASTAATVDSRRSTSGAMSPLPSTASSHASQGSGQTARERLHDFKDGLKDAFLPNRKSDQANAAGTASPLGGASGEKKIGRQEARKLRKAQAMEQQRQEAAAEVAAENDNSIEAERHAIGSQCRKLHLHIKEIEPDGHCMYSAIADQANFLKLSPEKETYQTTRKHAADYMRSHPDDFLPFLPSEVDPDNMMGPDEFRRYCDTVENTAEWGGEPEIRALSLHYQAPIIVIQAGTDMVEHGSDFPRERAMLISYHRKMYGLGEHYNSLRPSTHGAPHVLPPAPSMSDPIGQRVAAV
ncbi:hypothetical protein JCM3774_005773 [Rhodotorula dairenensis]